MAGSVVHYLFGTLNGALYGLFSETVPNTRIGYGTAFGAGLWAVADEAAVPAFGWSKPPGKTPASKHFNALAAHLVYGLATHFAARTVRRVTAS